MPQTRRFRFTDTAIKKLKPGDCRVEYVDSSRKGLRLRITPTGTKTFIFRYRFNDRARLLTLGEYGPALTLVGANQKLGNAIISLKDKIDPGEIKQKIIEGEKAEKFIPDLIDEYLEHHAKPNKATWQEDARILNKDVRAAWKYRKAKDIKRRDIVLLLDEVKKRGIPTRNRLLSRISKMFRIGVERDLVDASPAVGIAQLPEPTRKRILKDEEIKTFWNRLETAKMSDYLKTALKLLLVTGQRRGELSHAEWEHIDLVKCEWFMPITKNGETHRLPLSNLAIELFTTLKQQTRDSKWVLPSPRIEPDDQPITDRAMTRAMANNREHFGLEHFTPHDLRRTFVTKLNSLKIDRAIVERAVNHLQPLIIRIYDHHDYWDEVAEAMETWADELKRITGG